MNLNLKENHSESYNLVKSLSFCVFDLETTGGNHKNDKIIEVGLVKINNFEIIEEKSYLIKPEVKIPEFIQRLTSISEDDVRDSPIIEDVIDDILEFMGDSILVAHNTSFDIPFFNSVLRRCSRPELKNRSICTNLMTKYLIPNLLNSNLNYMSKIFGISHKKAHRALDDARATAYLLMNYLSIFIKKNITKINHLYYPRNKFELDRVNYKSGAKTAEIIDKIATLKSPFLFTLKGENGVILFSCPCENNPQCRDFIEYALAIHDLKIVSIALFGPFIEACIHFGILFNKIDANVRSQIITFLNENYLNKKKPLDKLMGVEYLDDEWSKVVENEIGDFLISHHLVPDQLVIIPLLALHHKHQLIFRYPGHQKKLIQYINTKTARINSSKLKKVHFHPMLRNFLYNYLILQKNSDNGMYFIFKKNILQSKKVDFVSILEDYLAKHPNSYQYPKEYI